VKQNLFQTIPPREAGGNQASVAEPTGTSRTRPWKRLKTCNLDGWTRGLSPQCRTGKRDGSAPAPIRVVAGP